MQFSLEELVETQKKIVELSENKLKSGGRIVIGIILIETLYSVLKV